MGNVAASVLLIEHEPALRDVNTQILNGVGYQVEQCPQHDNPVTVAEQIRPDVIVIGMRPSALADRIIVEDLQRNPKTRAIPVVVIATSQHVISAVATIANVYQVVVAPYRIETLETAVARALGRFSASDTTWEDRTLLRLPG